MSRELDQLRGVLDSNDPFMTHGHQIIKSGGATRHANRMLRIPAWALDDQKIKELIKLRFPKAMIDPEQRRLAARMIRLIHLYYRVGATASVVAEELDMTLYTVKRIIQRLNKQMAAPLKASNRPKKNVKDNNPTSF